MKDVDIVRKALVDTAQAFPPPEGTYVEAFAALARMECALELQTQDEGRNEAQA